MTQANKVSLKDEAAVVIAELIAKEELNPAVDNMIAELKGVSTFTCVDDISQLIDFLEKVKQDNSVINGREETLFGLHLLSISGGRHEELNGKEFTLAEIEKNFRDTLLRLFGITMPENTSLTDMASEIKKNRQTLAPGKVRYEKIDGKTCHRLSCICQQEDQPAIQSLWEDLRQPVENAVDKNDIITVIKKVTAGLFTIPGTDFVLFSGPVRPLTPQQDTTINEFFSYVFTGPRVSRGKEKSQMITGVFRGARKRYFSGGYHVLLPAVGDNEDCRKEHRPLEFKSFMRTPGTIGDQPNAVELRCASQDADKYSEKELNSLINYMKVLEKIIEGSFKKGIVLANQLEDNDIIFTSG